LPLSRGRDGLAAVFSQCNGARHAPSLRQVRIPDHTIPFFFSVLPVRGNNSRQNLLESEDIPYTPIVTMFSMLACGPAMALLF
jgi:hypothetical protein